MSGGREWAADYDDKRDANRLPVGYVGYVLRDNGTFSEKILHHPQPWLEFREYQTLPNLLVAARKRNSEIQLQISQLRELAATFDQTIQKIEAVIIQSSIGDSK